MGRKNLSHNGGNIMRRYDVSSSNPTGWAEDTDRCIVSLRSPGLWPHHHQCNRKRGYGIDRLYCKQHAKMAAVGRRLECGEEIK